MRPDGSDDPSLPAHTHAIANTNVLRSLTTATSGRCLRNLHQSPRSHAQNLPARSQTREKSAICRAIHQPPERMGKRDASRRNSSDLSCGEDGVEEQAEGRVRLTAMLDGKSKEDDVAGADRGLHHRSAARDQFLAFEPAAEQHVA